MGAVAFKSTHKKITIQSARSACRTKHSSLGHSDSYTGVLQPTFMRQLLTTCGQEKLSSWPTVTNIYQNDIEMTKDGQLVYKRNAKYEFWFWRSCLQQYSHEELNRSVRLSCRTNLTRLGHSDSYAGVLQSTSTVDIWILLD